MPNLSDHQSNDFVKAISIGDSMAGKTGALVSLVKADYKLRILDLDNKLDILKYMIMKECPDKITNVEFKTLRDKRKSTPVGIIIDGPPKAFIQATKMLDHWKYDDVDLGKPAEWGPDCVLVIDSLSRLCDAAFDWREPLTPRGKSGDYDKRATYGDAQGAIIELLANITSEGFRTNVIVIAHIQYLEMPDGTKKGFPQSVGKAIAPEIPQYFPSAFLFTNKGGKRTLQTNSTPLIDLANPAPFEMQPSYPIETGLADFFGVLRDPPKTITKLSPKIARR